MAREIPSVGDLRRKSEITDDEIAAATSGYLEDEDTAPFVFTSGPFPVGRRSDPPSGSGRRS